MRNRRLTIFLSLAALICLLIPTRSFASDETVSFDLTADSSVISVWIDLSFLLSNRSVELLDDGVEYVAEIDIELVRPRRLFGTKLITEAVNHLYIRQHLFTKEYQVNIDLLRSDLRTDRFTSLGALHRFLADSIVFNLKHELDISSARQYEVNLEITSISLTSFNLKPSGNNSDFSESALQYLFSQFLNLTGYGRETVTARSRSFRLSELSPQDR